jgi:hypothetical protein
MIRQYDRRAWHVRCLAAETSVFLASLACCFASSAAQPATLPWVAIGPDRQSFVLQPTGKRFSPWGFNYDHDDSGRLIENYWERDWAAVEQDFREMRELGANVVRIHLQYGKFMETAERPNARSLERLAKLLKLAEHERLYLDLTGLGCYHKQDVPDWYDRLSESARWEAQARFWEAIAQCCRESPAVFCYDLMNEPVVPGGRRKEGEWLGPAFGDKHFVQMISLDQRERPRPSIARGWIQRLAAAIRKHDRRHLITVGLVDWSLDRKGLTSGFVPDKIADDLDFLSVHIYPERGKVRDALETLAGFAVGKPVVIEETFPLKCSMAEFEQFIEGSRKHATGWIGFYWGKSPAELRQSGQIRDAMLLGWLDYFVKQARGLEN